MSSTPPPLALLTLPFLFALLATTILASTLRLLVILPRNNPPPPKTRKPGSSTRLLVVLGSGGHTAEMLQMLRGLETEKYTHRTYVVSSGDGFSAERAREFEEELERGGDTGEDQEDGVVKSIEGEEGKKGRRNVGPGCYDIAVVPRARKVHQSLLTTPVSALHCLWNCFAILRHPTPSPSPTDYPDLILTNGPGTAVIVILASLLLRFFDIAGAQSRGKMRTIYVESFARVTSLSLSGRLLLPVVNRFLVQWEGLEGCGGGKGEYEGVLV